MSTIKQNIQVIMHYSRILDFYHEIVRLYTVDHVMWFYGIAKSSLPAHPHLSVFCTDVDVYILGWGLLRQFSTFRYFPKFSAMSKHTLAIEYHVYIWQVSPQLSCGGTLQI